VRSMPQGRAIRTSAARSSVRGLALPAVQQTTDPVVLSGIKTNTGDLSGIKTNTGDLAGIKTNTGDLSGIKTNTADLSGIKTNTADLSGIKTNTGDLPTIRSNTTTANTYLSTGYGGPGATTWATKDMTASIGRNQSADSGAELAQLNSVQAILIAGFQSQKPPSAVTTSSSLWPFAQGGIASPGMPIIFGEHNPRGPFLGTVGSSPVAITPGMPSFGGANDNALLAEVKRLNDKIDRLERVVAGSGANVARAVIDGTDKVADKVNDQTDTLAAQERQNNRQRKVA
jgi:hypothetical protein